MKKRAIVLFDLDGTLIDSTPAIYKSFCAAFTMMGQPAPNKECVVNSIGHTLENMFLANGATHSNVQMFIEHYRVHYRALMEAGTRLLDNAESAIKQAYTFAHLAVVTTKRGDFSQILLKRFNVLSYFDCVIGIESVTYPKPHKEPILRAISHINAPHISNEFIFMIGDTSLDMQSANDARINSVGVLCGFGKEADLARFSCKLCLDTQEAVAFIARKCGI